MKHALRNYFYFTNGELRGVIVLLTISILFLCVPKLWNLYFSAPKEMKSKDHFSNNVSELVSNKSTDLPKLKESNSYINYKKYDISTINRTQLLQIGIHSKTIDNILKYRDKGGKFNTINSINKIYGITLKESEILKNILKLKVENLDNILKLVSFDPNIITQEELISMGLRPGLVKTFINFRNKGFVFKNKSDIEKIYGVTELEINKITPFLKFDNSINNFQSHKLYNRNVILLEINTSNETELIELKGVGTVWASKIYKYRESLGGFHSAEQIKELRNIEDTLANLVIKQITCNSKVIQVQINTSNYECLTKHPYINGKQAKVILNYIKQHGYLNSKEDLINSFAFNKEELLKIEPYISYIY